MRNADTAAVPPADPMSPMLVEFPFAVYAWGVLVYNLAAILWGAVVRVTGSGAGCGDHWPLCNGTVTLVTPNTHTLIEFAHRVMSGLDVALVAGLLLWAFRRYPRHHAVRLGAVLSGVFLVTEALLGAGLVLLKLVARDATAWSQSLHLLNTLALVASLALTAWWASGHEAVRPRGRAVTLGAIGVAGFALLGVSGVIAALGDTLFPAVSLSQGLAQDFNPGANLFLRLRIWHPALAIAVALWLLYYALWSARESGIARRLSYAMIAVMVLQMAAGVLNLLLLAPVGLQLIHLLLADLLWISMVLLISESGRRAPQ